MTPPIAPNAPRSEQDPRPRSADAAPVAANFAPVLDALAPPGGGAAPRRPAPAGRVSGSWGSVFAADVRASEVAARELRTRGQPPTQTTQNDLGPSPDAPSGPGAAMRASGTVGGDASEGTARRGIGDGRGPGAPAAERRSSEAGPPQDRSTRGESRDPPPTGTPDERAGVRSNAEQIRAHGTASSASAVSAASLGVAAAGGQSAASGTASGAQGVGAVEASARGAGDIRKSHAPTTAPPRPQTAPGEQVARGMTALLAGKGGSVTLKLSPAELGQVKVRVEIRDGVVTARFTAETEQARGLLRSDLESLRAGIEARGLRVDRLEVEETLLPRPPEAGGRGEGEAALAQAGRRFAESGGRESGQDARGDASGQGAASEDAKARADGGHGREPGGGRDGAGDAQGRASPHADGSAPEASPSSEASRAETRVRLGVDLIA